MSMKCLNPLLSTWEYPPRIQANKNEKQNVQDFVVLMQKETKQPSR